MKEPTIWEEIVIQNEIEEALQKVEEKYNISIDYTYGYKEGGDE